MRYASTARVRASFTALTAPRAAAAKRPALPVALVVQKFGGTSVGSIERIRNVARRAIATQRGGQRRRRHRQRDERRDQPPARARARGRPTVPDAREMDAIAATGEQVSAALTAMAIQAEGGKARSLLGHQVQDPDRRRLHQGAHQGHRRRRRSSRRVDRGEIAVVAGFQGVDDAGQHHDARARRVRHERGRRRRGHRRRRVRDLHRRRRRLHDRPERLPVGAEDRPHLLRRDARARVARRQGAPDPQRGDCDEVRRSGPRPKLVQRPAGDDG